MLIWTQHRNRTRCAVPHHELQHHKLAYIRFRPLLISKVW